MPQPPKKITFLITDLHLGGSPRILRDLALGLHTQHFSPSVISLKPLPLENQKLKTENPTIPATLRAAGIPVHSLNLAHARQFPAAIPRLARLLNQLAPDILYSILIHANALTTCAYPFLHRTPAGRRPIFIQSIHTLQERPVWHWTLQGKIARFADAMIVPSQPILDRLARHGPVKSGTVIPNGIDIARFADAQPIAADAWPIGGRSLKTGGRTPIVGYVGRFDPVKNLPLLLRAFAQLTHPIPPHLVLVGYGPEEKALRDLATSLHIAPRVHFPGPTTTPERWYKSFDCLCLPSSVEGFGLTLIEAMAAGIPVIAPHTPVTAAIVRDGIDGHLLPPPLTPESLTKYLQAVITNSVPLEASPTCPHQSTLSYLHASFSIAHMVELHAKFLQKIQHPPE